MQEGILYKIRTEGRGQQQFECELYACPQPAREGSEVNEQDLKIFVKDVPFNFAVKQVLEKLGDPSMLAKVSRLCTISATIPVYTELVETI